MTPQELNDALDRTLADVIEDFRKKASNLDQVEFAGSVTGFLIKTGIHLAAHNGCPNAILRSQVAVIIKEAFKQKPWVVMTGKGLLYIVVAHSHQWAQTVFQKEHPGAEIASIAEAEEVL